MRVDGNTRERGDGNPSPPVLCLYHSNMESRFMSRESETGRATIHADTYHSSDSSDSSDFNDSRVLNVTNDIRDSSPMKSTSDIPAGILAWISTPP